MRLETVIIFTLIALLLGGGASVVLFLVAESRERRKHYKATVTIKPDGTLDVYKSKLCDIGREPITIPGRNDTLLLDIDVCLSDGEITITDLRSRNDLDWM